MRTLPDKISFNMDRPKLEAYIAMSTALLEAYKTDLTQEDKLVAILLERLVRKLKTYELKLQHRFNISIPLEQALGLHIALLDSGGIFHNTWLMPYYNGLILQIDPILS